MNVQKKDDLSSKSNSKNGIISDEEKQRREEIINFARANVGLEGFVFTELDEADAELYINGEIDMDAYIALGFERVKAIFEKNALDNK